MTNNVPPEVNGFFDPKTNTISYIVADPVTKQCAVIDSVFDFDITTGRISTESADQLISYIHDHQLKLEWILETHVHADHLSAATYLKSKISAKIGISSRISKVQEIFGKLFNAELEFDTSGGQFDCLFEDKDEFVVGNIRVLVLHTPGHTPACATYVAGNAAFVGDALFMPDYGTPRTDFPGGDATQLYSSIRKILSLPSETRLFTCHDYKAEGRDDYLWESTVAAQRASNIHISDPVTEVEFVKFRRAHDKNLDMPKLLLPSVQVNMRAGQMPPKEGNQVEYLKIPINQF